MRYKKNNVFFTLVDLLHHRQNISMRFRIKTCCRLIENKHLRLHGDDARNGCTPLLPTRKIERRKILYFIIIQSYKLYGLTHTFIHFFCRKTQIGRSKCHILCNGFFKQLILRILEHQSDFPADVPHDHIFCRDIHIANYDMSLLRLQQSVEMLY